MDRIELKSGNSKLAKHIGVWSITAGMETCGRVCAGCYAIKFQKMWGVVRDYNERMYQHTLRDDFVDRLYVNPKFKYVRVHASGEFYSQEYIDKWVKIAEKHPHVIFYAYTKRLADGFDFSKITKLSNFVIHDSLVGDGINFGKNISAVAEKHSGVVCPDTLEDKGLHYCGSGCTWCMQKHNQGTPILFEKH